ncbi:MAG: aminomethyl-transferring glycine dehydrogenase subunit GcvPA [Candidatus Tectomicrobia bacterium]|uniref:Probable glycine dehydrogenase (decarboxylating) subunit 1 n=1 Tax=Tectimicrobiota bacterium TaxID=2528274 RepID=A0A932CLK3_UNCTE|nr:aminomethyl-transferring glycine dehydrogenase subunit GcvPA [Candidatus Tectomicrobia bacterium]
MRYLPNTDKDLQEMLREIGVESLEDLLTDIPQEIRLSDLLRLPPALSEPELAVWMKRMGLLGGDIEQYSFFLGAGAYSHYIPSIVRHLAGRSEFYTTYTPYQPELSQGTLQAIYEFQTLICQLTGMEIANASMYDGASALAEAVLMAHRIGKGQEVLISQAVHPEYRQVVRTYTAPLGLEIRELPFSPEGTSSPAEEIEPWLSDRTIALILQSPNFFGCIEDLAGYAEVVHHQGALLIVSVVEPTSLGILKPPGAYGADIVVGEGQSFGIPVSFGGPFLGFFATRSAYLRHMPGRLVGETTDLAGHRGYVLVRATREQHIRRERATSNICTNHSLCALAASIYLSALGKEGLRELALLNLQKANYARTILNQLGNYSLRFTAPTYNEFVLTVPHHPSKILQRLLGHKIVGGVNLGRYYPNEEMGLGNCMLWCFTETSSKGEIDRLFEVLRSIG